MSLNNNQTITFNIITPTVLRPSLIRLCESINNQTYTKWKHIVLIDYLNPQNISILKDLTHENRKLILYNPLKKSGYPASEVRVYGYNFLDCGYCDYFDPQYTLYIDDDDYYIEEAFELLYNFILENNFPNWGLFPAKRLGQKFYFPHDIRLGRVMGTQLYHNSNLEVWPKENMQCDDWETIKTLQSISDPVNFNSEIELTITDQVGGGL